MAKTFFDMTQIPSDKIKKILEEAMDGCYDTFNKVMEQYGFANGIPADEFVNKAAKNVLLRKRELLNAFVDMEIEGGEEAQSKHHAWIMSLVRKMFDRFLDITATREAAIADNITSQATSLSERIEENKRSIADLRSRHDEDCQSIGQRITAIEERVEDLENRASAMQNAIDELTELTRSLALDVKLVSQTLQDNQSTGTQSHGISYSVSN